MQHELPASFSIRRAEPADRPALQTTRQRAFRSVYESFRRLVGEDIFRAQFGDADARQGRYLDSICEPDSGKEVYVLLDRERVIGFVGLSVDVAAGTGEIDLNAVDPDHQGRGGGQFMYTFALGRLKELGASVARVSTGNDASHAAARAAYARAGFSAAIPSVTLYRLI